MIPPFVPRPASWQRDDYLLSTDPGLLDVEWVHHQLSHHCYWAKNQSKETTLRTLACSLPFGLYAQQQQIGFGRLITDYGRFAYLSDVIIAREHRGKGLGQWFARCVTQHPDLSGVKRWMLATDDAHAIYQRAGWQAVAEPGRLMEFRPTANEVAP
jgi:GNAT superfamily N-acetyltransferase